MKKDLQMYQKNRNIEPVKACTITNKALTQFVNEQIMSFIRQQQKQGKLGKVIVSISEEKMRKRVIEILK